MSAPIQPPLGLGGLLRSLLGFARPHWIGGIVLMAGLLIETGFDTLFRFSFKLLIDEAIVPGRWQLLLVMLLALGLGAIFTSACSFGCDYLWARIGSQIINSLRLRIFEHLQRLHMGFHSRSQIGDLMARCSTDLSAVETGLVIVLPAGIVACSGILFSMALLFRMEWHLALLTALGLPLCVVGPKLLGARAVNADYALKQQEAQLASLVQENLTAQSVVKAYCLEPRVITEYRGRLDVLLRASVRSAFFGYLLQRLPNVAVLLIHLIVIGTGAVLAFRQLLSVGDLVAFQVLFTGVSAAVTSLTWVFPSLAMAAGSMQRISEILDEPPAVLDPPQAVELREFRRSIRFENVSFGYTDAQAVLSDVSLDIPKGSLIAFVGVSGSGKTTLLSLLLRFYDPQNGSILIDGADIRAVTQESLRRRMAIVFQENVLFNVSVRENIRFGRAGAMDEEVEQAARQAEIHDFIFSLPEGYATLAGERGSRFSGGQRQRIALARALLRNPEILLLDEATSALDPATEAAITQTLKRVGAGRTVIMVTHRLQAAVDAGMIVVMENGRVVEQGRHEDLLARAGRYSSLWKKQDGLRLDEAGGEAYITVERLREIPVFSLLDDTHLAQLSRELQTERCAEEAFVFKQGEPSDKFYVVAHGRVAVTERQGDGRQRRIATLAVGDCFGEMGLVEESPRDTTVQALTPCVFFSISHIKFSQLLADSAELRSAVEAMVSHRDAQQRELQSAGVRVQLSAR